MYKVVVVYGNGSSEEIMATTPLELSGKIDKILQEQMYSGRMFAISFNVFDKRF